MPFPVIFRGLRSGGLGLGRCFIHDSLYKELPFLVFKLITDVVEGTWVLLACLFLVCVCVCVCVVCERSVLRKVCVHPLIYMR